MKKMNLGTDGSGIETQMWIQDDELILVRRQDVSGVLDQNQRLRNSGGGRGKGLHHIASVPTDLYQQWRNEWKAKHSDRWEWMTFAAMKLRDRDYSKLRTTDMKI